jgi:formate hydrogenlyase transcriptional activator
MTIMTPPCEAVDADSDVLPEQDLAVQSRRCVGTRIDRSEIVGNNHRLADVLREAEAVAMTDAIVLVLGETGTGKELLAQHMHRVSRRSAGPFVATNVAAIPATLLESEVFGRERGAYTGAMTRQIGRFEMVRVITATNRKLPDLVRAGAFRQDLYYRLNVFPLTMPPLRDRPDDIPALVWAFVKEFSYKMGKPIERIRQTDLDALGRYPWPGNVRELRNVVERAMILTPGSELRLALPDIGPLDESTATSRRLRDVEQAHISKVLDSTGGRIRGKGGAAEILGLKPTTLYSLMQRLGIQRASNDGISSPRRDIIARASDTPIT